MTIVRPSTPQDKRAIGQICREAFGGGDESRLVELLDEQGFARLCLVAEVEGAVVGFILFSQLVIETNEKSIAGLALAPLAVLPSHQGRGLGSMLAREGLHACRELGHGIVIVLGHPGYYPRFGFTAEAALPLQSKYSGPSFMALALAPEALEGVSGVVKYPAPFDLF